MSKHRSSILIASTAAALCATTMIAAPPAQADDLYVGIAYSPSAQKDIVVLRSPSRTEAEKDALSLCSEQYSDCKVVGSTTKCMAFAVANDGTIEVGFGDTAAAAKAAAAAKVSGGKVFEGACSWDEP